jgi:hypothetical protein
MFLLALLCLAPVLANPHDVVGPCAHTELVQGADPFFFNPIACSCSDGTVHVGASAQLPGIGGLSGGYEGGAGKADCSSYLAYASYETYEPGGVTTVKPYLDLVHNKLYRAECDMGNCHKLFGFLFTYGSASCTYKAPAELGAFTAYFETGEVCSGSEKPQIDMMTRMETRGR